MNGGETEKGYGQLSEIFFRDLIVSRGIACVFGLFSGRCVGPLAIS